MLVWEVGTQEEAIIKERTRLEETIYEREVLGRFDGYVPKWIPKWLSQSNEEHLKTDTCKTQCKNCGEYVAKWIGTEFSFCNEYGCGIAFCEKCAKGLAKKFKEKLAQK